MMELVRGEVEQLTVVDRDVIRRDMTRMILKMLPEQSKKLVFTAGNKRYLMPAICDTEINTAPFGFVATEQIPSEMKNVSE